MDNISVLPQGNWRSEAHAIGATICKQVAELANLHHVLEDEVIVTIMRQVLSTRTPTSESGK